MSRKLFKLGVLFSSLLLITAACQAPVAAEQIDIDDIQVSVSEPTPSANSLIYTIDVVNNSEVTIKQLTVLLGFYPPNSEMDSEGDYSRLMFYCKPGVSAGINIEPGDAARYTAVIPISLLKEELINFNDLRIHLIGYAHEVGEHRFEKQGPLSAFQ